MLSIVMSYVAAIARRTGPCMKSSKEILYMHQGSTTTSTCKSKITNQGFAQTDVVVNGATDVIAKPILLIEPRHRLRA